MTAWRVIPGFTRYEASDDGQIRSIGYNGRQGRVLRHQKIGTNGRYRAVTVHDDERGRQRKRPVHVLVLLAWAGPRPDGMVARHLDDNRDDNSAANLAWGTSSENSIDVVLNGNHPHANKVHCPRGHSYDYVAPSGRGGRQCSTCHSERKRRSEVFRTHCRNGHPYPAEIQQRITDRQQRRYCPTCLANRKPRRKSQRKVQPSHV